MAIAVFSPNVAVFLFVAGALCVYVEFLRPGLIVPAVLGSALVILSLVSMGSRSLNVKAGIFAAFAGALFLSAPHFQRPVILLLPGGVSLALAVACAGSGILLPILGISFAAVSVFLSHIAIRARRNKLNGR